MRQNKALDKINDKNQSIATKLEALSSPKSPNQEHLMSQVMEDIGSQIVVAKDILSSGTDIAQPFKFEVDQILKDLDVDLDKTSSSDEET